MTATVGAFTTRSLLRAAAVLFILLLTLIPSGADELSDGWSLCILCGENGTASGILNILLFVPLGLALGAGGRAAWWYVLAGAALSFSVELTQQMLPGRNPTLGDIVLNTSGTALGVLLVRTRRRWLFPRRSVADAFVAAAGGFVAVALASTAMLAEQDTPQSLYFGLHTPDLAHFERYDGHVDFARIDARDIPAGAPFDDPAGVPADIARWRQIEIRGIAGPRTASLAPIVAVMDGSKREILVVGVAGPDLVVRTRTQASAGRMLPPDVRLAGGAEWLTEGEPFALRVLRTERGLCIEANGERACDLGIRLGDGWMLLRPAGYVPGRFRPLAAALWMAVLGFPVGFFSRARSWAAAAAAVLVTVALAAAPYIGAVLPPGYFEWLGIVLGGSAGYLVRRFVNTRSTRSSPSAGRPRPSRLLVDT